MGGVVCKPRCAPVSDFEKDVLHVCIEKESQGHLL